MGRPAKSIETQSGHVNSGVTDARRKTEAELKGSVATVEPSFDISENQRQIFERIRNMFEKIDLLGELDGYVLTEAAVIIDRLQEIDKRINEQPDLLFDRDVCNTRKEYMQNFFRICNELSLSPQSRAKMGILAAGRDKRDNDPILRIFGSEEGEME